MRQVVSACTRRRLFLAAMAFAVLLAGILGTREYARADVSDELRDVLSQIRNLSSFDFSSLVDWAKGDTERPISTSFQPEKVETDILDLGDEDKHAVLRWLRGNGRDALYDRGASDSEIGSRRDHEGPRATATPNAWRSVALASGTLDNVSPGKIEILGGFAAVKRDGSSAIACVSFKNVDPRVAKRVVFEFPLMNRSGEVLGKLVLDRNGEFSPNIDIKSFESMSGWQNSAFEPTKAFSDGCIKRDLPTAALPLLQTSVAGYRLLHVDYVDGTSWDAEGRGASRAQ